MMYNIYNNNYFIVPLLLINLCSVFKTIIYRCYPPQLFCIGVVHCSSGAAVAMPPSSGRFQLTRNLPTGILIEQIFEIKL